MGDVKRPSRRDKQTIAERRRLAAGLFACRVAQADIARQLKVSPATISGDLKAIRRQWAKQAAGDVGEEIRRELFELNLIESQAALQFAAGKEPQWLIIRLRVKERRARLLGLDAPAKADITSRVALGVDPEWVEVRTRLMETLAAHPEARAAVVAALQSKDGQEPRNGRH